MGYKEKVYRLCGKPRTTWVAGGRTDQRWRSLASGNLPFDTWNKNFKMSKECFYLLVAQLVQVIGSKPNSWN